MNFVPNKEKGFFRWVYPQKECFKSKLEGIQTYGRCNWYLDAWKTDGSNSIYASQNHRMGISRNEFVDSDLLVICASPEWCEQIDSLNVIRTIRK